MDEALSLRQAPVHEPTLVLAPMPEGQDIASDYRALGLSLRRHPLALLRARLAQRGLLAARELDALPGGRRLAACASCLAPRQAEQYAQDLAALLPQLKPGRPAP